MIKETTFAKTYREVAKITLIRIFIWNLILKKWRGWLELESLSTSKVVHIPDWTFKRSARIFVPTSSTIRNGWTFWFNKGRGLLFQEIKRRLFTIRQNVSLPTSTSRVFRIKFKSGKSQLLRQRCKNKDWFHYQNYFFIFIVWVLCLWANDDRLQLMNSPPTQNQPLMLNSN